MNTYTTTRKFPFKFKTLIITPSLISNAEPTATASFNRRRRPRKAFLAPPSPSFSPAGGCKSFFLFRRRLQVNFVGFFSFASARLLRYTKGIEREARACNLPKKRPRISSNSINLTLLHLQPTNPLFPIQFTRRTFHFLIMGKRKLVLDFIENRSCNGFLDGNKTKQVIEEQFRYFSFY